jgi:hypothetical protein
MLKQGYELKFFISQILSLNFDFSTNAEILKLSFPFKICRFMEIRALREKDFQRKSGALKLEIQKLDKTFFQTTSDSRFKE